MANFLTKSSAALIGASVPGVPVKVTSGQSFPLCRALWVGTAGTATLLCEDGSTATDFPLKEASNPVTCTRVTFGTASDVWAIY